MIVTITINPAIDRIISVDRLAFEDRAYIKSSRESAGGRGINASSVISSFGGRTLAVLTSGGDSGKRLESHLGGCGYDISVVPIQNEIRTNLTITDKHGLTVNLNEAGPRYFEDRAGARRTRDSRDARLGRLADGVRQPAAGCAAIVLRQADRACPRQKR